MNNKNRRLRLLSLLALCTAAGAAIMLVSLVLARRAVGVGIVNNSSAPLSEIVMEFETNTAKDCRLVCRDILPGTNARFAITRDDIIIHSIAVSQGVNTVRWHGPRDVDTFSRFVFIVEPDGRMRQSTEWRFWE